MSISVGPGWSDLSAYVHEGAVLAGKYRVERVLGTGGMGVVVAARHLQLDERVAIKFLLPEGLKNPEALARFEREARAAVKIKNEHVARMIDVGTLENGAPYIVMEHLDGMDLAKMLQSRRSLPVEEAAEYLLQACEALAEAHALGIIHRDLKPENLFVVRRGDGLMAIKVLDFGISKITGLAGSGRDMGMTRTSSVMGSPLYMSPEQMQSSRNVDARTDIWAMGVILYELIAGQSPFLAESMPELIVQILTAAPKAIRSFRPDAPEGFEAVILRCLEKDRTKRFANVAELAIALVEFAPKRARSSAERASRTVQSAGLSTSALAMPSSDMESEAPKLPTLASWGRTDRGTAGRRSGLLGFAVVLAVGFLGGGAMLLHQAGAQKSAGAPVIAPASPVPDPPSLSAASVAPSSSIVVFTPEPPTASATPAPDGASSKPDPPPRAVGQRKPDTQKGAPTTSRKPNELGGRL